MTKEQMLLKYDFYRKLKADLNSKVSMTMQRDSSEIISIKIGAKKIMVIDAIVDDKESDGYFNHQTRRSAERFVFFDRHFVTLASFIKKLPRGYSTLIKKEKINSNLQSLINSFMYSKNKTKQQKLNHYNELNDYELKKEFSKVFKVPFLADKEFFFFSNDEIRYRYHLTPGFKYKKPVVGSTVQITDSSALLFTKKENGKIISRSIDIKAGGYIVGNKFYSGTSDLIKIVKANKNKYDLVGINEHKKTFYKYVLKKNVDLSKMDYFEIKSVDTYKFKLGFDSKEKIYYFIDKKLGRIEIHHPDLLVQQL